MKRQLWILVVVASLTVNAYAGIRTVNQFGTAQYSTITSANTAAATGDTILVAPGFAMRIRSSAEKSSR